MAEKFAVPDAEEPTGFGTFAPGAGPAFLGGGAPIGTGEGTVSAGPTFLSTVPTAPPYEYAYPTGEPPSGYLTPTVGAPTAGPVVTVPTGYATPTGYVVPTGYGYEPTRFYPPETPPTVSGGVVIVVGGTLTVTSSTTGTFRVYASDGQTYTGVTTFDLTRTYVGAGGTFTVTGGTMLFSGSTTGTLVLHGSGGVGVVGMFTLTAIGAVTFAGGPEGPSAAAPGTSFYPGGVLLSAIDPASVVMPVGVQDEDEKPKWEVTVGPTSTTTRDNFAGGRNTTTSNTSSQSTTKTRGTQGQPGYIKKVITETKVTTTTWAQTPTDVTTTSTTTTTTTQDTRVTDKGTSLTTTRSETSSGSRPTGSSSSWSETFTGSDGRPVTMGGGQSFDASGALTSDWSSKSPADAKDEKPPTDPGDRHEPCSAQ